MKILICVLIIAAFVDILCYRIPNLWIAIGMVAGLVLMVREQGIWMLPQILGQMGVVFMIFYPFYLMKGLGAGDVKLFLLLGCYLTELAYLHCLLVAMLLAGIWALVKIVLFKECRERLFYLGSYCRRVLLTGTLVTYEVEREKKKSVIRLSVPILCSVLLLYGGVYS